MSYWKQEKPFNPAKMGKTKNLCLHNTRIAFDIPSKYASAKLAMNENRDKGTLHSMDTLPTNVSVPIFTSAGIWGHVMVSDKGVFWSDGVKCNKPNNSYMWGEWLNGVRVVSWVDTDQVPANSTIKFGDTVIVSGQGTATSTGNGAKTAVYSARKMKVVAIANGRYGCNQYNNMGAVTGWWTASQVKKEVTPLSNTIELGDTVEVSGQGTGDSKGGGGKTKNFSARKMKVVSIANGRYGCNQYNHMGAATGWFTLSQIRKV